MRIDCLSIFPEELKASLAYGVIGKALDRNLVDIEFHDIRAYTQDKHQRVDDIPYGGGAGMVFKPEPVARTLDHILRPEKLVIHCAPAAPQFTQAAARELVDLLHKGTQLVFIASRYEGLDHRIVESYVDREYSIGDFILSGGELAVAVMIDSILRLVPEVLGNPESSLTESFTEGLLEHPHYTRPPEFQGMKVPEVLLNGHHEQIRIWRKRESLRKTMLFRPDLLTGAVLDAEAQKMLSEIGHEQRQATEIGDSENGA